jgi:hypothetical protein
MSGAITWWRDRFPTLKRTEMVGGNPLKREPYAYVHLDGTHGIVTARNPVIGKAQVTVPLTSSFGLDRSAANLVLEKVYPHRWVSPKLFACNDSVSLELDGFETSVYEVYPVSEAVMPLPVSTRFSCETGAGGTMTYHVFDAGSPVKFLNPGQVVSTSTDGGKTTGGASVSVPLSKMRASRISKAQTVGFDSWNCTVDVTGSSKNAAIAILVIPDSTQDRKVQAVPEARIDGSAISASCEDKDSPSRWYTVRLPAGAHGVEVKFSAGGKPWKGSVETWFIEDREASGADFTVVPKSLKQVRPMPPTGRDPGYIRTNVPIDSIKMSI